MENILTAITTVGFPIAMCLMMGWYIVKADDKHDAEVNRLSTVIENNTLALEKLITIMNERSDC